MIGKFPFWFLGGIARFVTALFGFIAKQEDILRLTAKEEFLSIDYPISSTAIFGPAFNVRSSGLRNGFLNFGEQRCFVQRIFITDTADDIERFIASATDGGTSAPFFGGEQGLCVFELAGIY